MSEYSTKLLLAKTVLHEVRTDTERCIGLILARNDDWTLTVDIESALRESSNWNARAWTRLDALIAQVIGDVLDERGEMSDQDVIHMVVGTLGACFEALWVARTREAEGREVVIERLADRLHDACAERDRLRVELCESQAKARIRARNKKRQRAITREDRVEVLTRDGWRCLICGSGDDLHIDHVIPFSRGGSSDVDNLQTLCRSCNLKKRDTFLDVRMMPERTA